MHPRRTPKAAHVLWCVLTATMFHILISIPAQAQSTQLFLPFYVESKEITRSAQHLDETQTGCSMSSQEAELMSLIIGHSAQQRGTLSCHPLLHQVARERANDMAIRDYFGHVNPDGYGPNYLVHQAGFPLKSLYLSSNDANYIESIAGGSKTAQQTFELFLDSPSHREHLLGNHDFYRTQNYIGVGLVHDNDSTFRHYWVVLIAESAE